LIPSRPSTLSLKVPTSPSNTKIESQLFKVSELGWWLGPSFAISCFSSAYLRLNSSVSKLSSHCNLFFSRKSSFMITVNFLSDFFSFLTSNTQLASIKFLILLNISRVLMYQERCSRWKETKWWSKILTWILPFFLSYLLS
jgi:hypothetical protein